ncbi:MAG: ABC transporter substrate-binding protein, partial [Promicromonosporaceae bacterium]|nr:ABC transporter substrate-binding protein [Promicromonosporaceae bacterium]
MMKKMRNGGIVALLTGVALFASACGTDEVVDVVETPAAPAPAPETPAPEATTPEATAPEVDLGDAPGTTLALPLEPADITWMHNGTGEPLNSFWASVAAEFEAANPGISVQVVAIQNEELRDTVLPNAFQGGNQPDLFQSWGGGELANWVSEGIVMDLTQVLAPTVADLGGATGIWEVNGHNYGLPYTLGPAGFWVNLNLLNEAGLVNNATTDADGNVTGGTVDWPSDFDGLFAMWQTLRDHGITPVAVGGGDGWAAAWWYYAMASQACSPAALQAAQNDQDFSDGCWEQAAYDLQQVMDADAFNTGWQATSAQQGAASSAGQVIFGQAAMEFMGPWGGPVMAGLYHEQQGTEGGIPSFIGWEPVPAFPGGQGGGTLMAGGDGFSVLNPDRGSQARSDAAAALLAFILSDDVQTRAMDQETGGLPGNPTNPTAIATIDNQINLDQAEALGNASFTMQWLDTMLGDQFAGMNDAIVAFM